MLFERDLSPSNILSSMKFDLFGDASTFVNQRDYNYPASSSTLPESHSPSYSSGSSDDQQQPLYFAVIPPAEHIMAVDRHQVIAEEAIAIEQPVKKSNRGRKPKNFDSMAITTASFPPAMLLRTVFRKLAVALKDETPSQWKEELLSKLNVRERKDLYEFIYN